MIKGSDDTRMGDLISRRVPFEVPVYQRSYAWEEEEVDDYCKDISALFRARQKGGPTQHFFGGLVSVERYIGSRAPGHTYEVVDGQQRLATFILTIGMIVKAFENLAISASSENDVATHELANAHKKQMQDRYLDYEEVEGGRLRQKLRLRMSKADHTYFESLIRGAGASRTRDSHKRLQDAWDRLRRCLIAPIIDVPATTASVKLQQLMHLSECVLEDCHIIHIVSDNKNEAYRLFAILNDRGKTLSDGDLLRSHSLELLEGYDSCQEQVERHWDNILSGRMSDVDQFLRAYYPSYAGERAPSRDLFDHFRDKFFQYDAVPVKETSQASAIQERVENIAKEYHLHSRLKNGIWPYEDAKASAWDKDRLDRLVNVLKHILCLPLLLSAASCLQEEQFVELVTLLERFVFRYIIIVGAHPTPVSVRYYRHAKSIRENAYNAVSLSDELSALVKDAARDDLFELNLTAKLDYTQSDKRRLIKHFFTVLDDHYQWFKNGASGKPKPTKTMVFDLDQLTIEHIYPENASPQDSTLEEAKDTLGNLAILAPGDNRAVGNAPFPEKKALYARSKIMLTRDLDGVPQWNSGTVENRRQTLIKMAKKIFQF